MDTTPLLQQLPPPLSERVRPLSTGAAAGEFVLVWMRAACRAHDNPCLDVALEAADALGLPVFVYHALSERYPYASDRHHTFILEGARDAQRDLLARGLGTAFHLERPGHRGDHLRTLARRAALVVTEDVPVPPLTTWTMRLRDSVETPVWAVDASCLLPMLRSGPLPTRAFAFRKRTDAARMRRVAAGWADAPVRRPGFIPERLPFEPVALASADLAALVASCDVDHTVGPVPHTRGGRDAGEARWASFIRSGGLAAYAGRRNRPSVDGTSRLSPWLHYGHISPFQVARESMEAGADKFLDELLTWRELAWTWCSHQPELHTTAVLPEWARRSLDEHADDPRPALHSWETLARGQTGDLLWDTAQRSLLRHGELHNNVRMTWGKALLQWTPDAESARCILVDLNHRYALDGRDPASYGGLYWCLGLFDRPFRPGRPVLGELRARDTAHQAQRISMSRWRARVGRPLRDPLPSVAVVGAGMAGLTVARTLHDHGLPVQVFEKSRGRGGRMSTRRVPAGGMRFDHGAQFFRARDPTFRRWVESWRADGLVAPWAGRFGVLKAGVFEAAAPRGTRFVGVPGMSALGNHLARGLRVEQQVRVAAIEPVGAGWRLRDADGADRGVFERVLVAVPGPQAAPLLAARPALAAVASGAEMVPCLALMASFDPPLAVPFDAARVRGGPIAWVARDSSKPGRPAGDHWVAHLHPDAAARHLEAPPAEQLELLLAAFGAALGVDQPPVHAVAHRWRYARPAEDALDGPLCHYDPDAGLGLCGDWLVGARVEAAWRSGAALAGQVLGALGARADRAS